MRAAHDFARGLRRFRRLFVCGLRKRFSNGMRSWLPRSLDDKRIRRGLAAALARTAVDSSSRQLSIGSYGTVTRSGKLPGGASYRILSVTGSAPEAPVEDPAPFAANLAHINWDTMKIIGTHTHGMLDYVVGVLLIAAPWIFGFANGGPETRVPVTLGVAALVYSLITRYELGLIKALPFRAHLTLDFLSGVFLAASPWIFGFADVVYLPHLLFGLFEILAAVSTRTATDTLPRNSVGHHA